ncbi:MAG: FkbM family methyltransferase [Vicinamibacterales bacterium]
MSSPSLKLAVFARLRRLTLAAQQTANRLGIGPVYKRVYQVLRAPFYAVLRPRGMMRIQAQGLTWQLDSQDEVVARNLLTYGEWEPEERDLILGFLSPGSVLVDIGANFGYHAMLAAQRVGPQGHVFAFEPSPRNFELLANHATINGFTNVTAVPVAVSDEVGTLTLFLSEGNFGAHSVSAQNVQHGEGGAVTVPTTTLDAYFAERPGQRIDVIKMDAQGAEGQIIRGGRTVLTSHPGLVMILEFWPHGLRTLGTDPAAFLGELTTLGFRTRYLDGHDLVLLSDATSAVTLAEAQDYLTLICDRP